MNLEEMLRQERQGSAPNPLMHRTDEIVLRVRRGRRRRAATGGVVGLAVAAVLAVLAGQHLPARTALLPAGPPPSEAVPLPQVPGDVPLEPGRYVLPIADAPLAPVLPVLSVPAGYVGIDGGAIGAGERYVWAWDVHSVYPDPCEASAGPEPVGPSVADLAHALAAQSLREGADPVPVIVDGYRGLSVELTVPDDVDVAACTRERFSMWPGRWQEVAGQVDMVWIIDVDGQRITIDASHFPSATPDEVAELRNMVTTATFTAADDS